jgi:hypothetical protein
MMNFRKCKRYLVEQSVSVLHSPVDPLFQVEQEALIILLSNAYQALDELVLLSKAEVVYVNLLADTTITIEEQSLLHAAVGGELLESGPLEGLLIVLFAGGGIGEDIGAAAEDGGTGSSLDDRGAVPSEARHPEGLARVHLLMRAGINSIQFELVATYKFQGINWGCGRRRRCRSRSKLRRFERGRRRRHLIYM